MKFFIFLLTFTGLLTTLSVRAATEKSLETQAQVTTPIEKHRRFNFYLNPVSPIIGQLEGGINVRVLDRVLVGPAFKWAVFNSESKSSTSADRTASSTTTDSTSALLLRSEIFLTDKAFRSGFVVSPFAGIGRDTSNFKREVKTGDQKAEDTRDETSTSKFIGALAGYHWFYDNGLNVSVGAGARYNQLSGTISRKFDTEPEKTESSNYAIIGEVTIGFGI